jgi:phosphopantothenoylcysteine decarboxylase/phosphopantothenate--cysteine ligase
MSLKGKLVLITAGPTWVAIDRARVISNLATGETGFILADKFKKLGAKVTLLLGPGNFCGVQTGIKVIRFNYFSELEWLLKKELKKRKYSLVIHAAAVADYQPQKTICRKVSSLRKNWEISLVPTKKLIKSLRDYHPDLFTVGFKFEPNTGKGGLLLKASRLLKASNLDLVVANSNKNKGYQAYILEHSNKYGPFFSKTKLAVYLSGLIRDRL